MKRSILILLFLALPFIAYSDMISIPGGTFTMGIYQGYGGHTVTVSTFWMDAAHITVGEYQAYCAATTNEMPDAPLWGWDSIDDLSGLAPLPLQGDSMNAGSFSSSGAGKLPK